MGVVRVTENISDLDLAEAKKDYGDYIKVVVEVGSQKMTIGGEWHADGEKLLIENGSKQKNIWGGGIDLVTKKIDTLALINLRVGQNESQEILNPMVRDEFIRIVKDKFRV